MSGGIIALIVILSVLAIALALFFILVPAKSYFTAMFSGAYVSARKLMTMRFRKMPVFDMVNAYIKGKRGKVTVTINDIENMYAIKCDYNKVIEGFIACKNAGINYKFETIQKLYLSGKDINTFVKECLNSKVVDSQYITGVCGDLQELNVKVRLTLKVNLKNIFSTLNEETIFARINECILSKISSTRDHKFILSTPQILAKVIYEAEADSGNYYEIVSADVIEVSLGKNLAISREKEIIEKNRLIEQNRLEARRLTAVAVEQEMKARTEEMKAKLIEKEMEVPESLTKAINEGQFDKLTDFYKVQNLRADTEMRNRLAGGLGLNENETSEDFDDED